MVCRDLLTSIAKRDRVSLYYRFEESVKRQLHRECIWSREGSYSWSQVYYQVNQYGNWFLSQGVRQNDYVAFYLTNTPDHMFACFGLWSIGATPAMINYNLAGDALLHCLKVSTAKIMLVDSDKIVQSRVENRRNQIKNELGIDIMLLDIIKPSISLSDSRRPDDSCRSGLKLESPAVLLYTRIVGPLDYQKLFHLFGSELFEHLFYNCMPLYHGTGGIIAWTSLSNGIALAIGKKFSTSNFWQDVHDSRASWISYVGETARYLLMAPSSPLDTSHRIKGMYGNGLRPDVWIKFRDRFKIEVIVEFFGSSEGVWGLANICKGDYLATAVGHQGAIFRLINHNSVIPVAVDIVSGNILRDSKTGLGLRQPYEKGGEILVRVSNTKAFSGYTGNEAATKNKFAKDILVKGDLWYRTGDFLRRTRDGRWFFMDRLGDTYRWKAENVSTAEVSAVLGRYPGIVEANVYGVTLPFHDGKAGCAAIYIDPNLEPAFDYAKFLLYLRTQLPSYAIPIFLRRLKQITPTHNNKQSKTLLVREGVDPDNLTNNDTLLWITRLGKGDTYETFNSYHRKKIVNGMARL
ncbi:very long-chain fatty acyl-CoA synthetase [Blumeria hordei DH14]|uniref:Very long-chain fatty acyl-CoA synthetase n=1 Tax=Blumeria graminis f. sp. hordei (strain DH14) TaxID=546991 RepID=N1JJ85_BLUG1|nr:very long-chain fatty acyl-CoA synthetase [Blumeria hordei DH14]